MFRASKQRAFSQVVFLTPLNPHVLENLIHNLKDFFKNNPNLPGKILKWSNFTNKSKQTLHIQHNLQGFSVGK